MNKKKKKEKVERVMPELENELFEQREHENLLLTCGLKTRKILKASFIQGFLQGWSENLHLFFSIAKWAARLVSTSFHKGGRDSDILNLGVRSSSIHYEATFC